MKLFCCQIDAQGVLTKEQRKNNIERIFDLVRIKSKQEGSPDLIVFPELSTIEYSTHAFKNLEDLAEPLKGETFKIASNVAHNLNSYIAYGFPKAEDGKYFISQLVVSPEGEYVNHYDKVHIAQFGDSHEKLYFERGNKIAVFTVDNLKVGIIICYDFRFSEYVSFLVKEHDVDLIIHPSAFSKDSTFESWHHFVITRALENQIFYLSLNRSGRNWGNSIFCMPWMHNTIKPVLFGEDEEIVSINISIDLVKQVREKYPFYQDKLKNYKSLKL